MLLDVATLTQRHRIGDLGHAAIGEPNFMMSVPSNAEWPAALFTSPTNPDVEMSLLPPIKEAAYSHPPHPLPPLALRSRITR
jgi:hypothetical protein